MKGQGGARRKKEKRGRVEGRKEEGKAEKRKR